MPHRHAGGVLKMRGAIMSARDPFLDMLTIRPLAVPPAPPPPPVPPLPFKPAGDTGDDAKSAPVPQPRKPLQVVGPNYQPGTRPSFADEIDAMVAAMVDRGDVTLDPVTDTY